MLLKVLQLREKLRLWTSSSYLLANDHLGSSVMIHRLGRLELDFYEVQKSRDNNYRRPHIIGNRNHFCTNIDRAWFSFLDELFLTQYSIMYSVVNAHDNCHWFKSYELNFEHQSKPLKVYFAWSNNRAIHKNLRNNNNQSHNSVSWDSNCSTG